MSTRERRTRDEGGRSAAGTQSGTTSEPGRDGRGRVRAAPAILHYGFRPFFFLGALYAGIAIPAWLAIFAGGLRLPGVFDGLALHVHEMLFGFLSAVVAGFVLTAVPNWTGRLPLSGLPLAGLVALWAIGRVGAVFVGSPIGSALLDLAFPTALAASVWREVIAGHNWRNGPVATLLSLFGVANLLQHLEAAQLLPWGTGYRLALAAAVMMISLIGGRIVPSFSRNWLAKRGQARLPASFGAIDKFALATTGASVALWVVLPASAVTAWLLLAAGTLLLLRLSRWRGLAAMAEPIVFVLHVGYLWLAVSLVLVGGSILVPGSVPSSAAIHALTAGAIGTMTLAVMTRASLGHTRRAIRADAATLAVYTAVTLGAFLRVAAPLAPAVYLPLLMAGGSLWSLAFLLFAARYAPILWGALPMTKDSRP